MNSRITLLFGLLAVGYVLITWIGSGSELPTGPIADLDAIPLEIDGWVGKEVEISDDTVQVLRAHQFVNRQYRNAAGQEISMHLATWMNKESIVAAPHHPEICYPGAGWTILRRRTTIITSDAGEIPIELISFQRREQKIVTCHWFQVADVHFISTDGFEKQRHRFWGKKTWPSTTKILLQTTAPTVDAAESRLKDLAALVVNELARDRG